MPDLVDRFAWSVTRQQTLDECSRKYYLAYYGAWGGWAADADPFARQCYRLNQIQSLAMWRGSVVHRTVEWMLAQLRDRGAVPELAAAQDHALRLLRAGWRESKSGEWRDAPKRITNLFEHYYGIALSRQQTDALREEVLGAVGTFLASPTLRRIAETDPRSWLALEDFGEFMIEETPVLLRVDFALAHEGVVHVFDWKTGQPSDVENLAQLAVYALHAVHAWQAAPETTRLHLLYLASGRLLSRQLAASDLLEARDRILGGIEAMTRWLDGPREANRPQPMESFPLTPQQGRCTTCKFREICHGAGA